MGGEALGHLKKHVRGSHQTIIGSRSAFWTSDTPLEPEDEEVHFRTA